MASGTQSNLVAIMSHCGRGDEYIVGQMAHTYRWEGGGAAALGSVQPQPLEHEADGSLAPAAIEAAIKPDDAHYARSRLLCLENTIGGKALPMLVSRRRRARWRRSAASRPTSTARGSSTPRSRSAAIRARRRGRSRRRSIHRLGLLLEGAGRADRLGAGRLARADRRCAPLERKMLGGGMRQAGVVAAAALHALDHHIDRLADDHALATRLADGLRPARAHGRAAADQHRFRRPGRRPRRRR